VESCVRGSQERPRRAILLPESPAEWDKPANFGNRAIRLVAVVAVVADNRSIVAQPEMD